MGGGGMGERGMGEGWGRGERDGGRGMGERGMGGERVGERGMGENRNCRRQVVAQYCMFSSTLTISLRLL